MAITVDISAGKNDKIFGKSQVPIKSFLIDHAEGFEQASALKLLARVEKSTHWAEGYGDETAMDNFVPVGNGGTYPTTDFEDGWFQEIRNETWKSSFNVTREMVADHQIGKMRQRSKKLVKSYYRTREMFVRYLYVGALKGKTVKIGDKTFPTTSADQMPLFDKAHPCKVKGKPQCNLYKDEMSINALDAMESEMQNRRGDNGELLAVAPNTIWIPNDGVMKRKAFAMIGADKEPDTSNNGFNYQYGKWNIIADPYLTLVLDLLGIKDKPWFLLDSNFIEDEDGAILQDRTDLEVTSTVDDSNDNNKWKGYARFSGGFVSPHFVSVGGMTSGTQLVGP